MSTRDDDKFWAAVERADQEYSGAPDKDHWIDSVMKAGADKEQANAIFAMFQDADS